MLVPRPSAREPWIMPGVSRLLPAPVAGELPRYLPMLRRQRRISSVGGLPGVLLRRAVVAARLERACRVQQRHAVPAALGYGGFDLPAGGRLITEFGEGQTAGSAG